MSESRKICMWCGRRRTNFSEWEQQNIGGEKYSKLCSPCAKRRLNNPFNALLNMRKISGSEIGE